MNRLRSATLLGLVCLLGGCAIFGGGDNRRHPTLASLEREHVDLEAGQHIEHAREKAAANYRRALETRANPRMEAEALRRLADLELQGAEESLLDGQSAMSGNEFDEAIASYESLLKHHPESEDNDRVLYQLARAQENAADIAAALASLDRLVREFPESGFVDEANFRRGEMLFQAGRYADAERAYGVVVASESSSAFQASALYKQGWSLFKQSLHEEALAAFFDLMDRKLLKGDAVIEQQALSRPEQELIEDTLRAVSISLSYFPSHEEVDSWLAKRNIAYDDRVYASLADLYFSQERFADAARAARAFVTVHPLDSRAPSFQLRVIETWRAGGFPGRVLEAKAEFVNAYAPGASFWGANDSTLMPEVSANVQSYLRDLAGHYHASYQALVGNTQSRPQARDAAASEAVAYYQRFLKYFPGDTDAGPTSFLMAELLFDLHRFDEAATAYEQAAYRYGAFDRQAEAAYAALLAYDQHAQTLTDPELGPWRQASLASALRFAEHFPEHPQASAVLTRSAEEVFARGDLTLAIELAERVLQSPLPAEPAVKLTALTVSGHARFDMADFAGAQQAYQSVLDLLDEKDDRRAALNDRLASSIYKQGEISREQGDLAAAAQAFHQVALLAPDSQIRTVADYDAAAMLIQLQDWPAASAALSSFLLQNPQHELAGDVQRQLVLAYQQGGEQAAAARELEKISQQSGDPLEQEAAQWQAAELYVAAGATEQAIPAFENYVARFADKPESAMEARQSLVELQRGSGRTAEVSRWQQAIVAANHSAGKASTPRMQTLAAHASLALAEPVIAGYKSVKLRMPLARSLKEKKRRMELALDTLANAAALGISEVTTRATFETAAIYRDMGSALMDSERPKGLSPEQSDQYEIVLEEQAFPFEEKAIELHEANVARLKEGVFDDWVQASLDALAKLLPARYAKHEISEDFIAQIY